MQSSQTIVAMCCFGNHDSLVQLTLAVVKRKIKLLRRDFMPETWTAVAPAKFKTFNFVWLKVPIW